MKRLSRVLMMVAACVASAQAVEIPLGGGGARGAATAGEQGGIAYVDIQKVFSEHPMTARLKGEFTAEVEKRKKELDDGEREIERLNAVIKSSSTEAAKIRADLDEMKRTAEKASREPSRVLLPGTTITVNAEPVQPVEPAALEAREKELKGKETALQTVIADRDAKRDELKKKTRANRTELPALEEKQTQQVLSDIYHIFDKLARDENVTIIIDKDNVLYGKPAQDFTDRVLDRVRGR